MKSLIELYYCNRYRDDNKQNADVKVTIKNHYINLNLNYRVNSLLMDPFRSEYGRSKSDAMDTRSLNPKL